MLLRIQNLWLALSAIAVAQLFYLPVYAGQLQDGSTKRFLVTQNYLLLIAAVVLVMLPLIAIIQFKNRSAQRSMIWLALLLQGVFLALIWMEVSDLVTTSNYLQHNYKVGAVIPVLSIIFLIMALQGIRKDEKLLKNAERLR